jgi:hypothetical protein
MGGISFREWRIIELKSENLLKDDSLPKQVYVRRMRYQNAFQYLTFSCTVLVSWNFVNLNLKLHKFLLMIVIEVYSLVALVPEGCGRVWHV